MKINKILLGERVLLRDYAVADLCSLADMWLDPENGKYMSDPTREFVDERFQRALDTLAESEAGYYLTVEEISSGEIIGSACAFPDEAGGTYDIGYCIRKSRWHCGFGTETVTLLLEELRKLGAKKVTAEAALLLAQSPELTVAQLTELLLAQAQTLDEGILCLAE